MKVSNKRREAGPAFRNVGKKNIYISDCKISLSNSSFVLLFPSSPGLLYQNEVKCSAFDTEMIFHSHANKTNFRKKGCVLGLILKARVLKLGSIFTSPCGDATAKYIC